MKNKVIGDHIQWFIRYKKIIFKSQHLDFMILQRIIKMADKDMSGTLSYEEFIDAVTD